MVENKSALDHGEFFLKTIYEGKKLLQNVPVTLL